MGPLRVGFDAVGFALAGSDSAKVGFGVYRRDLQHEIQRYQC